MNVLVTGGAGYIGSHACKQLYKHGINPIAYDNLVYGHTWAVRWGELIKGDILDTALLIDTIHKYNIQAVLHFAAYAYVGESVQRPDIYYHNNVVGTLSLLKAMQETHVKKLVFSSTCATYGNPTAIPIDENHTQNPVNPYGATKLMIERILQDYHHAFGLRSLSLRYFNAAGADADLEIGEAHSPETHLLPLAFDAVLNHNKPLTVFGNDYPTPDGTCIRDYIHVTDLAEAHVAALTLLAQEDGAYAYNLGNEAGFSVKQIIDTIEKITGSIVAYTLGQRRPGDPAMLIGSNTKARDKLNWQPKHADIEQIITTGWQWHNKFILKQHAL